MLGIVTELSEDGREITYFVTGQVFFASPNTYIYARGDGHDVVTEAASDGVDTLVLEAINPSEVSLVRNGNDLTLVIAESTPGAGDGGSILLNEEFDNYFNRVSRTSNLPTARPGTRMTCA